jgi:hypothetical protein
MIRGGQCLYEAGARAGYNITVTGSFQRGTCNPALPAIFLFIFSAQIII